jgi:hypothetical protein
LQKYAFLALAASVKLPLQASLILHFCGECVIFCERPYQKSMFIEEGKERSMNVHVSKAYRRLTKKEIAK